MLTEPGPFTGLVVSTGFQGGLWMEVIVVGIPLCDGGEVSGNRRGVQGRAKEPVSCLFVLDSPPPSLTLFPQAVSDRSHCHIPLMLLVLTSALKN